MKQNKEKVEVLKEDDTCHAEEENTCECGGCCHQEKEDTCQIEELNKKIAELENDKNSLIEKVKLAQADLINYRRRKDEEVTGMLKFANKDLIMEIIPIVDNFERAIKLDDNDLSDDISKFLAGFKMMYAALTEALKKFGVEEINRVGEVFDPTQEQALLTDHVDGMEDEVVIEVLLKGYKLHDRVIRPASVKINQN